MDATWGQVTQTTPLLVRISGDIVDTPISITDGSTFPVGAKVALIRLGERWWTAGRIDTAAMALPQSGSASGQNVTTVLTAVTGLSVTVPNMLLGDYLDVRFTLDVARIAATVTSNGFWQLHLGAVNMANGLWNFAAGRIPVTGTFLLPAVAGSNVVTIHVSEDGGASNEYLIGAFSFLMVTPARAV